jgi:hypothetical protein
MTLMELFLTKNQGQPNTPAHLIIICLANFFLKSNDRSFTTPVSGD